MKTSIKYLFSLFIVVCVEVNAQDVASSHSNIPNKTTAKGRRELRKDIRVKRHTEKSLKTNQAKQEKQADKPFIKKGHPKVPKNKNKERENGKKE